MVQLASLTPACFFLISVAYKLAWTAISSLLSQLSRDYGPEVLLQLNIAYFLPSIPVLVLQTLFNDRMDRQLGSPARGAALRFTLGLGSLVLLTASFPYAASNHSRLLLVTCAVGVAYGLAFGTSYQLASRFAPICTVMLTTGFVSSGPIVLTLDLMIKEGTFYHVAGLQRLFWAVSVISSLGLVAAYLLLLLTHKSLGGSAAGRPPPASLSSWNRSATDTDPFRQPAVKGYVSNSSKWGVASQQLTHGRHRMEHEHSSSSAWSSSADDRHCKSTSGGHVAVMLEVMEGGQVCPYGATSSSSSNSSSHVTPSEQQHRGVLHQWDGSSRQQQQDQSAGYDKQHKPDMPLWRVALSIAPAAVAIFLSVGSSMLVFPFFTYMQSSGLLGQRLPQVLFYVRLIGDILGRLMPRRLQAHTVPQLLLWAGIKTAMVPLLFAMVFKPHLTAGDAGAVVLVGAFWVLSGYVNTCAYLVGPTLVPRTAKAQASGLMTVAFQSSCLVALLFAAAIQHVDMQPEQQSASET